MGRADRAAASRSDKFILVVIVIINSRDLALAFPISLFVCINVIRFFVSQDCYCD